MIEAHTTPQHLIIGGTIKAATSSVFAYLSAHPEICGSRVKETFFFTHKYTGVADRDRARYMAYFAPTAATRVMVEASPNYLGYKVNVAPLIRTLLPEARLLVILRDPVDRIYSHYNFAAAKLELPEGLTFEAYLDLCERYSSNAVTPAGAGIAEKHLRALEIGKYSRHLRNYYEVFDPGRLKIAFYDDLKADPRGFMQDICVFAGVDPGFYRDYTFGKVNVTFSARRKTLHLAAIVLNRVLESVLRQRPGLKTRLVRIYKRMNQSRVGYAAMAESTRVRLASFYARSNQDLGELLGDQKLPSWLE